jgi:hypothetical protein
MAQASYWTVEEVDLSQDYRDWERLTGALAARGGQGRARGCSRGRTGRAGARCK